VAELAALGAPRAIAFDRPRGQLGVYFPYGADCGICAVLARGFGCGHLMNDVRFY
jgi:hypothetical protein